MTQLRVWINNNDMHIINVIKKNMYDIDIGHIKNISDVYIVMKKPVAMFSKNQSNDFLLNS